MRRGQRRAGVGTDRRSGMRPRPCRRSASLSASWAPSRPSTSRCGFVRTGATRQPRAGGAPLTVADRARQQAPPPPTPPPDTNIAERIMNITKDVEFHRRLEVEQSKRWSDPSHVRPLTHTPRGAGGWRIENGISCLHAARLPPTASFASQTFYREWTTPSTSTTLRSSSSGRSPSCAWSGCCACCP